MKVITFSKKFPAYHPRKGEETLFEEKIISGTKRHTIRAGHRWKVGEKFSPRVWSDKPYRSKQIQFTEPLEIKKIYDIQIEGYFIWIDKVNYSKFPHHAKPIAENDGLSLKDFWDWFPYQSGKVFHGQILCWDESIEYVE